MKGGDILDFQKEVDLEKRDMTQRLPTLLENPEWKFQASNRNITFKRS